MEKLETLASITRLSESVIRVLGQNPGKFTLQGTNTYVFGKQRPFTLVDTGEGRDEYIPILESALRDAGSPAGSTEPDISDIIISHWHGDHVGGIPSVLALLRRLWDERNVSAPFKPPRLHKFPGSGHTNDHIPSIFASLPAGAFLPAADGEHFHPLTDGSTVSGLQVLHTPGHTVDSICIYFPQDEALYTADTVLGQGTAVFEDLATYIASLRKMLDFVNTHNISTLYPGHGPVISDGRKVIETYIKHRLEREAQILGVIKTAPLSGGPWTTWTIVTHIYAAYPESLWLPAAHGVDLHLRKLEGEGVVRRIGGEGKDTAWVLV